MPSPPGRRAWRRSGSTAPRSDPLLSQDGGSRLSGSSGRPFWRISKYSCTRSASEEPALADHLPLLHQQAAVVRVGAGVRGTVLDDHQVAVATHVVHREHHLAGQRGLHRLAQGAGDADALVELVGTGEAADHRPLHRPLPAAQGHRRRRRRRLARTGVRRRAATGDVGRLAPVEAHHLADLDRVGRADAVGARQVLVVPAVPGGDRIEGVAALDAILAAHDLRHRRPRAGSLGAARGYRQQDGDQEQSEEHTESFSR